MVEARTWFPYLKKILVDERHLGDQTTTEDKISHVDVGND
jgi:hypothetical protein